MFIRVWFVAEVCIKRELSSVFLRCSVSHYWWSDIQIQCFIWPPCIRIAPHQDAFEVSNPLASAKTSHKVSAVYLSVANLPLLIHLDTDHMSLVLLCRNNDLKEFGHDKMFSELLTDLNKPGRGWWHRGIRWNCGQRRFFFCISGDNLGSHPIVGFCENLSRSQHFCSYCLITQTAFQGDGPHARGPERTTVCYNSAVDRLQMWKESNLNQFSVLWNTSMSVSQVYHLV